MAISQREILLSLIQGIEGRAWADQRPGWEKTVLEVCTWDGVICDPTDQETVIGISLSNERVMGTLPSELGNLVTLRIIQLSQNLIEGGIPSAIANLPHLEVFELNQNMMSGYLPVFASPLLKTIDLANNRMYGSLPETFGYRHARLELLDLSGNLMYGKIPDSVSEMKNLKTLAISGNSFSGTIPAALGDTNLSYLYMDNNNFVGVIPPEILAADSPLMEVWFQHNYLSGTLPAAIGVLPDLYDFYIDGNKFTGSIPDELCSENLNKDFFDGANGEEVDHDYCDAVSCAVGKYSFDGLYPCKPCEAKTTSPYIGQVGGCIDSEENKILKTIFTSTRGQDWNGRPIKGWDDDSNYCTWTGVTCDNANHVMGLDLKGMNLQGQLPEEIGFLKYLSRLDVSDNQLYGVVPSDLRWAPLESLDLSGNKLGGVVPPMLCLKPGINKNGLGGDFNCEHIACSVGTFSETGYAFQPGDCKPCETALYLGAKECKAKENGAPDIPWFTTPTLPEYNTNDQSDDLTGGQVASIFFGVLFSVLFVFMGTVLYFRNYARNRGELVASSDGDDNYRPEIKIDGPDVAFT